jgi:hypothetical protein
MVHNRRRYSTVNNTVKPHSITSKMCPYFWLILVTESNDTARTLSRITTIRSTSNAFPANVFASKITDLIFSLISALPWSLKRETILSTLN